ncbi:TIGR04282 family arsenosugar biosynthesis glycosyltransferase [Geomonas ferrireducens]|uniref:TIGR04282 family arsenosugar biosynthesis glycosyltransferase n=1 Tax=Geomonas ferrireducens TaxID=2570227 RepID=UPI0010A8F3D5|nr:TIGR04282 family arsenosugar biosynthesis glycosyltransferase [Geomonas ferrireducens]
MKRALAIFAKAPLAGRVKTRLSPSLSPQQAADLYRCMLLDTMERVAVLDADKILFHEGSAAFFKEATPEVPLVAQAAGGLGTKLEHACDTLRSMGYGPCVVIGTDAPDLPVAYIEEAFRTLERGSDTVFGPAGDGGYYLVGLRGGYGSLFRDIPWSSEKVLEKSLAQAKASGFSAPLLPPWHDLDCYEDLLRPDLMDPGNGAVRTQAFIAGLDLALPTAAGAL